MSRSGLRLFHLAIPVLFAFACGKGLSTRTAQPQRNAGLASPSLGTAAPFSVLAGSTVTNTGPTTMNGDLGVSPGTAITGFPPGLVTPPGAIHDADAVALQAQNDVTTAYNVLAGEPTSLDLTGQDLGGMALPAGVYSFSSSAQLTGTLVLDAKFDANAVFIFQIGSKLTTASGASIRLINGADPCNVFWQVGSSATVGTSTSFTGNILALTSIALQTGASLNGRALARNAAVTLDSNVIRSGLCTGGGGSGGGTDGGSGGGSDGGQAELSCCLGAVACNGACVNLQNDSNNCGGCGKHCSVSEVCIAGACTSCPATDTQCADQCANLMGDPFNCGACGKVCAASQSCIAGSCGTCDGTVCANTCVDLNTDRSNCGACGNACAADQCCNAGSCSTTGPNGACRPH